MEKLTEVLSQPLFMGGYAVYIWPSFILAAVIMALMVACSLRSLRKAQKTLAELQNLSIHEA